MATRVLICDDDVQLLWEYHDHLCHRGFEVATATDGLECVAKLRGFLPDVVVLEPKVLWGRGEGVIAMMREERDVPMAAVIVVTSDPDLQTMQGLAAVPIKVSFVKPLAPDRLEQTIRSLVEHLAGPNHEALRFNARDSVDLNVEVEHWIDQRTAGRIHGLHVDVIDDRLIVHGYTGSYYARQLVMAAAQEVLEASWAGRSKSVELDVAVVGG